MIGYAVVAVYEAYPFAEGVVEAEVAGGGDASVGRVEDADAAVLYGVFITDGRRAVGRAVIYEQQLEVGERLCEYRVHTPTQPFLRSVHRNYN